MGKDSVIFKGLANETSTMLQGPHGKHKLELRFFFLLFGRHKGGKVPMGGKGSYFDQMY